MMQQRKRAHRIGRSIKDELCPLRPARIPQWNHLQSRAIQQLRELLDALVRRVCRLERPDPRITINLEAHMTGRNHMTRWERGPANHIPYVLSQNLFVSNSVLHRANRTAFPKNVRGLLDCWARVRALCSHDSEIARRNLSRIGGGMQPRGKLRSAADAQPVLVDRS